MRKYKSDILLESLNESELGSFDKFLHYSLNGKAKDVLKYWNSRYSRNSNSLNNKSGIAFSRKILSDFSKQIEKFYMLKSLEKDEASKALFLSRELRRRNIYKYYEQVLNYLKEAKKKTPGNSPRNRLNLLHLNFEKYLLYSGKDDYTNLLRIAAEENRITEVIICRSKLFEYFNEIYYGNQDRYSDTGLIKLKDVVNNIENKSEEFRQNYPNVWVLYLLYKITQSQVKTEIIEILFKYLQENENNISEEFLQFSYDSLFELLLRELTTGGKNVREDFYKVFLDIEKKGTLKRLIHIRPRYFPLFTAFILESRDIFLAEKFLHDYKSKLVHPPNQDVLNLCMARIEFSKENFDNVKKLLKNVKTHDPVLYMQNKVMMLRTYYEKNEPGYVYPLIDTIKHFLKRKALNKQPLDTVTNFLYCFSKLIYAKKHHGKGLEYIEPFVSGEKFFMQKKWITEKYNELKAIYKDSF